MSDLSGGKRRELRWGLLSFLIMYAVSMLRFCGFGVRYFHQLDDYIQYCSYPTATSFLALAKSEGLLASRPLAGMTDYFVWGRLFEHMIIAVAVLTALYVASMLLLRRILLRYFNVGPVFLAVTCLLPVGTEGLYWVSASSRVVMGIFFAVLAAWAFARWLDSGRVLDAALYAVLQLIPFGYYEQCAVLGMTLVMGMALLELRRRKWRAALALWALGAFALYFKLINALAAGNPFASRMELMNPLKPYYWRVFLPEVLRQMRSAFLVGGVKTTVVGFARGAAMLGGVRLIWLALLLALAAALGLLLWKTPVGGGADDGKKFSPWFSMFCGLLLAIAPATPFLIIGNPWVSLRATVPSFAGFALMAEAALVLMLKDPHLRRRVSAVTAAALVAVFSIAALTDMHDYRATTEYDARTATAVIEAIERDDVGGEEKMGILNLEPTCVPEQTYYYHEHIHGCMESDWAFSGLLVAKMGRLQTTVIPMGSNVYEAWNRESRLLDSFTRLYVFDTDTLIPVSAEKTGENAFDIVTQDGALIGRVYEDENRCGHYVPAA